MQGRLGRDFSHTFPPVQLGVMCKEDAYKRLMMLNAQLEDMPTDKDSSEIEVGLIVALWPLHLKQGCFQAMRSSFIMHPFVTGLLLLVCSLPCTQRSHSFICAVRVCIGGDTTSACSSMLSADHARAAVLQGCFVATPFAMAWCFQAMHSPFQCTLLFQASTGPAIPSVHPQLSTVMTFGPTACVCHAWGAQGVHSGTA